MSNPNRQYDLVILGATGYTGKLTAEHVNEFLPIDLKWAVAGRSAAKLEALVEKLKVLNPKRLAPCKCHFRKEKSRISLLS
jgi:short subunit dehydrogenase-like uncharacterized protein